MAINAEWLWTPNDGQAEGERVRVRDMALTEYNKEIAFYVSLITRSGADIVALSEIENQLVVNDFTEALGGEWRGYFRQGRDTATGQDVALLSRLSLVNDSVSDFGFPAGRLNPNERGKRLSKVIGAIFVMPDRGEHIAVLTTHFLSKRNDSAKKTANRLRQSQATLEALKQFNPRIGAVVVLGDLNDFHHSAPLKRLRQNGGFDSMIDSCPIRGVKTGTLSPNQHRQVDHILFKGLQCDKGAYFDLKEKSDHYAVWAHLKSKHAVQ